MLPYTRTLIAGSLALAAHGAAAVSPYHAHPYYAATPAFAGAHYTPWAPPGYPRAGYRPPPAGYQPPAWPAPWAGPVQPRVLAKTRKPDVRQQPADTVPEPASVADRPVTSGDEKRAPLRNDQAEFFERLQPLIAAENARLLDVRDEASDLIAAIEGGTGLRKKQRTRLAELARRYRIDGNPLDDAAARRELLEKIDVVPVSMALAQAANESAWGKSRFAREANNLFGIWTYDESQGVIPRKRAAGKKHLVRKFDSLADSVRYYVLTLNSHPAYAELRAMRAALREKGEPLNGLTLADGLTRYSAKGDEYVRLIQAMIRRFDLASYDGSGPGEA